VQALQNPFQGFNNLFQSPSSVPLTNTGAGNITELEQSAPGPESAVEIERFNAEGPAGAGDFVAEGEKPPELEDPKQPVSAHGADFGNGQVSSAMKPVAGSEGKEAGECLDCTDDNNEQNEGASGKFTPANFDIPSSMRFPKWELPAFICLFYGVPNRFVLLILLEGSNFINVGFCNQLRADGEGSCVFWWLWCPVHSSRCYSPVPGLYCLHYLCHTMEYRTRRPTVVAT
jgi:hypothetical protein